MEHKIFSVYDQKAFAYLPPFTLPTADMAMRAFADCVNSKDHAFGRNPGDYTLFELGQYDDNKGEISPHLAPLVIGSGLEYIRPHTNQGNSDGQLDALSDDSPIQPGASG